MAVFVLFPNHILADLVQAQADHLAGRIPAHCNAIDHICHLNGITVMGDDDELGFLAQFLEKLSESSNIRLIQHGIHLIHHAEWRWRDF